MIEKLRQITDTIHQTIYFSELESNLMSTAYFYRLHDVYQSSTVYLAFPPNRTKRYEHSCGAMVLAGEMFFSSVTNANSELLNSFFSDSEKYLETIVTKLLLGRPTPTYCTHSYHELANCFPAVKKQDVNDIYKKIISESYENFSAVQDVALSHYMPPFSDDLDKRRFLYQCLLEAVRIVALFHDIGHPPYSHIMENVLDALYEDCLSLGDEVNARRSELLENLRPFKNKDNDEILCLLSEPLKGSSELHEQIGLKMLASAFNDILQKEIQYLSSGKITMKMRSASAVYLITVAEFCFAILREQSPFFISLHRIVDGCVDADRMDYIVRDSHNSGVDLGVIPYKRMLESCKMMFSEEQQDGEKFYRMAFPRKMSDHIDDLLITRYKIFSRINYHHRSYKTALILQELVKTLAIDYLDKDDSKLSLCSGISDLWSCLASTLNSGDLYIIQWNDSTLISHLYHTLASIKAHSCEDYSISEECFGNLVNMLEEFLLNRKHFYSVFKRQSDWVPIFSSVIKALSPSLDRIRKHEREKFTNATSEKESKDAEDSIRRLTADLLDRVIQTGDSDALIRLFPVDLGTIIQSTLEKNKEEGKIASYLFDENKKRSKSGLPTHSDKSDYIYLYDTTSDLAKIYDVSNLNEQIVQLQNTCLQFIAYIEPTKEDSDVTIAAIRQDISNRLLEEIKNTMRGMFSFL